MHKRWTLGAMVLLLSFAAGAWAQTMATLELVAVGFADPHEITVDVGSKVQLAYMGSNLQNVAFFEDLVTVTGPATDFKLLAGASWWEQLGNTLNDTLQEQLPGVYKLLGESGTAGPPFSYTDPGPVSLAILEFECQDEGDVIVTAVLDPLLAVTDPQTANPLQPDSQPIDLGFSNGVVTIHQGAFQPPAWSLDYGVAAGDEAFGEVTGPGPGTYLSGAEISLLASATDPAYYFGYWEETVTGQVPGGDSKANPLVFTIDGNVGLVAHFAQIPEPLSLSLLGLGVVSLAVRRRRR